MALLVICWSGAGYTAAPATDVIDVNLAPLIDQAVRAPNRFAVDVAHRVSSAHAGEWTTTATQATWKYTAQIPTAVSISFHGSRVVLPPSAVLTMTAGGVSYPYRAGDIHGGELWSRVGRGDTIELDLTVDPRERGRTLVEIASFQAGYRALAPGMPNHPHYDKLQASSAAAASLAGCTENYECHVGAGIQGPGQATVALVISNTLECTGTLINDVPQDGLPYVLTARHCENGQPGGGSPGAASSVVAYWDAVSVCGQPLASIFNATTTLTYGAITLVEQQDMWLIRLSQNPPPDAYYAGWDASGAAPSGGYSVHHANASAKQYVAWSGNAVSRTISSASLGVGYSATFWEVVNALGSIDHGASGGGLFTAGNQLVGTLSRGLNQCPVNPPPAPSDSTADGLYDSLAAVWQSTADATSSTATTTIGSVLDPGNTGTLSLGGAPVPFAVSFTADSSSAQILSNVFLSWSSPAQSCAAAGGNSGDGWIGNLPPNGTTAVSESAAGTVIYTLVCTNAVRSVKVQVAVTWTIGPPVIKLIDNFPPPIYVGQPNTLSWKSNLTSCTASGGTPGDGWTGTALPPSGGLQVIETAAGAYTYTLTCATGTQSTQATLTVVVENTYASVTLLEGPNTLRIGQTITLSWGGSGPCRATGGAAGDGWAGNLTGTNGFVTVTENTAGTYTYGLTCGPPGAVPASGQVSQTFTAAAAAATLTANPTQQQTVVGIPGIAANNLTWVANVKPCSVTYAGPVSGTLVSGWGAVGGTVDLEQIAGPYTYTLACGTTPDLAQSTATINWTQPTPQVSLSAPSPADIIVGQGTYLTWGTNVLPCTGSGGTAGDGWNGPLTYNYFNSSVAITEQAPGTYNYVLTCGVGPYGTASATIVFNNPGGTTLTLAASNSSPYTGQSVTLSWSSQIGPCVGAGGVSGDGWSGAHSNSGSLALSESAAGTYQYVLVCGTGTQAVQAEAVVTFSLPPNPFVSLTWNGGSGYLGQTTSISWQGFNGETCIASGGGPGDGWPGSRPATGGTYTFTETQTGTYTYTMTCTFFGKSASQSVGLIWYPAPAVVTLSPSAPSAVLGHSVQLTWSTSNATACTASGGAAGDGWAGDRPVSGSASLTESTQGSFTYTLSCVDGTGSLPPATLANATVWFGQPPTVTVSADQPSITTGGQVLISWNSTNATTCTASGGSGSDGWGGNVPGAGNASLRESSAGTYKFTVQCTEFGVTVSADTSVTVTAAPSSGGSGGGGSKGGGGSMDWGELLGLLIIGVGRAIFQAARSNRRLTADGILLFYK
jgi:hypothetical protein